RNQPDQGDHGHHDDKVRAEPVVLLASVKHHLERGDSYGKQSHAPIIDGGRGAANVWWVEDIIPHEKQSEDADRQINEENPPPGMIRSKPAAKHRSDDRRDNNADAP